MDEMLLDEQKQPQLRIQPSNETFHGFIERGLISEDTRERISKANVLMIPNEGYVERADLIYFPSGTSELYQFLKENQSEELSIDICLEEKDYKEVALHADWLMLAGFIVTSIVAPLFVDLLGEYIKRHLGKRESGTCVKSRLIIREDKDGRYIDYTYEGPASEYRNVMSRAISKPSDAVVELIDKPKSKRKRHSKRK